MTKETKLKRLIRVLEDPKKMSRTRSKLRRYFEIIDVLVKQDHQNISMISGKISGNTSDIYMRVHNLGRNGFVVITDGKMNSKIVHLTQEGIKFWKAFQDLEELYKKFESDGIK